MKRLILFFIIAGFFFFNVSTFAELNVDDLGKIQKLLDKLEDQIDKRFTDFEKRFTTEIQSQGERVDFIGALMIALIVAIIGFVSVPVGIIIYQYNKIRAQQDDEIKVLREKVEALEKNQILRA